MRMTHEDILYCMQDTATELNRFAESYPELKICNIIASEKNPLFEHFSTTALNI